MTRKQQALELIQNTEMTVPQIHKGTGLPLRWLQKFKKGDFVSEDKADILYNYLKRRK